MKVRCEAETDEHAVARLKAELQLHHRRAERAYQQLREDTALAQCSDDVDTITFDLQQSLPTPTLTVNVVFYKRQLWVYNLGVHDCATEGGYMHMWDESTASCGSQEVSSCIFTYLRGNRTPATQLIAYSDSCGGQNRNINMVCFWMYVVASSEFTYTVIDHKFMHSGHSYLPNDRDFGGIESARRRRATIYVPEEWYTLVEDARRTNRFHVHRMEQAHFLSMQPLVELITNRKVTVTGRKVEWLNMHWIRVEKDKPYMFKYRLSHNDLEEWNEVDLRPRRAGRPQDMGRVSLPPLYPSSRPINVAKLKDLHSLLHYVPPVHHDFYKALKSHEEEQQE